MDFGQQIRETPEEAQIRRVGTLKANLEQRKAPTLASEAADPEIPVRKRATTLGSVTEATEPDIIRGFDPRSASGSARPRASTGGSRLRPTDPLEPRMTPGDIDLGGPRTLSRTVVRTPAPAVAAPEPAAGPKGPVAQPEAPVQPPQKAQVDTPAPQPEAKVGGEPTTPAQAPKAPDDSSAPKAPDDKISWIRIWYL